MENLSNSLARARAIADHIKRDNRETKTLKSNFSLNGEPVEVVYTFSRDGKRIAFVEDGDGDRFKVFYEMLE